MTITITEYNSICNLGQNTYEIFRHALDGDNSHFDTNNKILNGKNIRLAKINKNLPTIEDVNFNTRCNRLILLCLEPLEEKIKDLKEKYGKNNIGIVIATTNTGVEEYSKSQNKIHSELGNPALFTRNYLGLEGYYNTISTACSSGAKAFSLARNLLNNDIAKTVLTIGVDPISTLTLYGFDSLGILSENPSNPLSKNRTGINIGEGIACFILEKNASSGIDIIGIGENTDSYHMTSPNPTGEAEEIAILNALTDANIKADEVDYINLHGTGTFANDTAETNAIWKIFKNNTPASSTKQLTGHCLGASASIETALCCQLIDKFNGKLYPHVYDGKYDDTLPKINLVSKNTNYKKCNICISNSYGFNGTNTTIILRKRNEE